MILPPPPPPDCWIVSVEREYSGDYNRDGSVDGADVEAFFAEWSDGLMIDADVDGCIDFDYSEDLLADQCDVLVFFYCWEWGA